MVSQIMPLAQGPRHVSPPLPLALICELVELIVKLKEFLGKALSDGQLHFLVSLSS